MTSVDPDGNTVLDDPAEQADDRQWPDGEGNPMSEPVNVGPVERMEPEPPVLDLWFCLSYNGSWRVRCCDSGENYVQATAAAELRIGRFVRIFHVCDPPADVPDESKPCVAGMAQVTVEERDLLDAADFILRHLCYDESGRRYILDARDLELDGAAHAKRLVRSFCNKPKGDESKPCVTCDGSRRVYRMEQDGDGTVDLSSGKPCPDCTGKAPDVPDATPTDGQLSEAQIIILQKRVTHRHAKRALTELLERRAECLRLKARDAVHRRLVEAVEALGGMPDGWCHCSKDRNGERLDCWHEPECRDVRKALASLCSDQPAPAD